MISNRSESLVNLEKNLKLNFEKKHLLETALTHSSYANQKKDVQYNERLEFLGDAVLQVVISDYLFNKFLDKPEGELTKLRSLIVCENSLFCIASNWKLGDYIRMSKGEEMTGGRHRTSILADCVEAIIASVYLDKGTEFARRFILDNFSGVICKAACNEIILDYKTRLQEKVQQNSEANIEYKLTKFEGPPHRRIFYVEVLINNVIKGKGNGYSKKEAEQNSAKEALGSFDENHE